MIIFSDEQERRIGMLVFAHLAHGWQFDKLSPRFDNLPSEVLLKAFRAFVEIRQIKECDVPSDVYLLTNPMQYLHLMEVIEYYTFRPSKDTRLLSLHAGDANE